MIFNSLRINNYRAYYGESIFDFPIEGERNISILYADNDVGKSCFFSAILFCLYGPKDSDDLKDQPDWTRADLPRQQFYSAYMVLKTVMISKISSM